MTERVGLYGTRYACDGKELTVYTIEEHNVQPLVNLANRHSVQFKGIFAVNAEGALSVLGRAYAIGSKVFLWDDGTVGALEADAFEGHVQSGRMKAPGPWVAGHVEIGDAPSGAPLEGVITTNAGTALIDEHVNDDPVTSPSHYRTGKVETIDVIRMTLGDKGFVAYCLGNAIKYRHRAGKKDKDAETRDVRKAQFYEQMAAHVSGHNINDPRVS